MLLYILGVFYDIFMSIALIIFVPVSFFNKKLNSYRKSRTALRAVLTLLKAVNKKNMVFYCSSVGELEQSIPLMEKFEKDGFEIIVICHSKNGYDYCGQNFNYTVFLSPFDFFLTWHRLLKKLKPYYFVINRHEFWPGAVLAANLHSKLVVINYVNRSKKTIIEKLAIKWSCFVFSVNEGNFNDEILFSGDTRFDRLIQRFNTSKGKLEKLKEMIKVKSIPEKKLVVVGNAYNEDMLILINSNPILFDNYGFLIIPARSGFDASLFSQIKVVKTPDAIDLIHHPVTILNTMGMLFEMYSCADIAWVGGGFSKGIHNCLEPAFYKIPVICGPNLNGQPDALNLFRSGNLLVFKDQNGLLELLSNKIVFSGLQQTNGNSPTEFIYTKLNENNYPR